MGRPIQGQRRAGGVRRKCADKTRPLTKQSTCNCASAAIYKACTHKSAFVSAAQAMSASLKKADKGWTSRDVRFVPKADSSTAAKKPLFNHLVGAPRHGRRNFEPE